jgi:hypothetical protein
MTLHVLMLRHFRNVGRGEREKGKSERKVEGREGGERGRSAEVGGGRSRGTAEKRLLGEWGK